jgi:uncharacterized iron-regulated protein
MNNYLLASRNFLTILLTCSLPLLLSGCLSLSDKPELTLQQHKLVGKIWDPRQHAFIDKPAVLERISETEYLLLGERHDNPVHHQLQTWFIQQLRAKQSQASVSFEMIDVGQAKHLAEKPPGSADQLITVLNQTETNWRYETNYRDLFSEVMAAGYPVYAANLNRKQLMQIIMQGEENLPGAYKEMLDKTPLSKAQLNSLQVEIREAHCNMLDDNMTNNMVLGQRLRDAIMAHSLSKSRSAIKVLIAGSGHVRNDRGVPFYLNDNNVLAVSFMEVESGIEEASSYAENWGAEALPFDIVWFTPKVVRHDPCETLKQHLENN